MLKLACEVVDTLLVGRGDALEIWQMTQQSPNPAWPAHASRAFKLVQTVLKLSFDLACRCSARSSPTNKCEAADVHSANFLLPLMHRGLCAVRYCDLSTRAKQLAWHTARACASQLLKVLRRAPADPGASASGEGGHGALAAGATLRLTAGQPVLLLLDAEADGRLLYGDEGAACPAETAGVRASAADGSEVTVAKRLNGESESEVRYDSISQLVMPWKKPSDADDEFLTLIDRARDEYKMIVRLRTTCAGLSVNTQLATLSTDVLTVLERLAPPVPELKSIGLIAEFGARLLKRKFNLSQPKLTDWIRG